MLDVGAGKALDRPDYTVDRYVKHTQGTTALTVTAPADRSPATELDDRRPAPRRRATRSTSSAVNQDDHTSLTRAVTAGDDGAFSVTVPLTGGTTVLNIVATSPTAATARAVRTVVLDYAPGTLDLRPRRSRTATTTARATTPIRRRRTSSRAPTTCSASRSTTRATGSSSASARAT